MKKDLTHLLRKEEPLQGFEDLKSAKEYLARYLLNYINLELQGLPKEEWERTVRTWVRIVGFGKSLISKSETERRDIYRRYNFNMMMEGIAEDVRRTVMGLMRLGLVRKEDPPDRILLKAVDLVIGEEDLLRTWDLDPDVVRFLRDQLSEKKK